MLLSLPPSIRPIWLSARGTADCTWLQTLGIPVATFMQASLPRRNTFAPGGGIPVWSKPKSAPFTSLMVKFLIRNFCKLIDVGRSVFVTMPLGPRNRTPTYRPKGDSPYTLIDGS